MKLKDAAARELMLAEEAAMMDKVERFFIFSFLFNMIFAGSFLS